MAKIRINYHKVISQAQSIEEMADDIKRQTNEVERLVQTVHGSWKGKASEEFLKQVTRLNEDLMGTYRETLDVSRNIRRVAERIKRQDELDRERAQRLK